MTSQVINGHELVASKITVLEKKKLTNGSEMSYLSYDGRGKFSIQTPVMRMPFGVSPPNELAPKYSAALSFDGMDKNPKLRAMHDALVELDERMIDLGVENSVAWFGKKYSRETIETKYKRIVKVNEKKPQYAPTMKTQVRTIPKAYKTVNGKREPDLEAGEKLEPVLYDLESNLLDYGDFGICDAVPFGSLAAARLEVAGVWFITATGYGISLRFTMARVKASAAVAGPPVCDKSEFEEASAYSGPAQSDETAEDAPVVKSPPRIVKKTAAAARAPTPEPEPEAEEEDAGEDAEPAPAPVIVKKPIIKKKVGGR
jgi:hypothetical protein